MEPPQESAEREDLRLAEVIQKTLLTRDIPKCQCGSMVLKNRMSQEVGGDFYHFRQLSPDQVVFAIGDVMGHGMSAALMMTLILGFLRADSHDLRRPSRIVESINEIFVNLGRHLNSPVTCSMIYGVVDLPSGLLLYVNAGHPHPIIFNRLEGKGHFLPPTTMLLGVQNNDLSESCYQFRQMDRMVLFTDGVVEVRDDQDRPFGDGRLMEIVTRAKGDTAEDLAQRILAEIDAYIGSNQQADDQTLVVIDFDNVSQEL